MKYRQPTGLEEALRQLEDQGHKSLASRIRADYNDWHLDYVQAFALATAWLDSPSLATKMQSAEPES